LVKEVSKKAKISDTIEKLPNNYNTIIGERGVFLSGGQRQRVGIARALYKNSKILIFDEATSALDNETEIEVMREINQLNEDLTILIVAHRTTTLKQCDYILNLKNSKISITDKV
jgi:ATP-binding cassette subfamily B protein